MYNACATGKKILKNIQIYTKDFISKHSMLDKYVFIKCLCREMVYHALEMISNTNLATPIPVNYQKNTFGPLGANVPKSAAEG